jgi:DNA-binding transcriptional regulator YiaG
VRKGVEVSSTRTKHEQALKPREITQMRVLNALEAYHLARMLRQSSQPLPGFLRVPTVNPTHKLAIGQIS